MKPENIKRLFEPRSVAVIGASHNPEKIGYKVVENILEGAYEGDIYPVNPKGGQIQGLEVYSEVTEIEGDVDLAVVAIPADFVYDEVKECAKKDVKYLAIITSGFSEVGNLKEERKIASYAREHGMRVLGPNIFGIYSAKVSLNATFSPGKIREGNVAIITQSGALGLSMIGKTAVQNMGLSSIVSVGNKCDLDESELLTYLMHQDETDSILMYMEGVSDKSGQRLAKVLRETTKVKPVIVIKSGKSKRGAQATASHTGSLAGQDEVFDDIMGQCGVIRAESIKEAFDWCMLLTNTQMPKGENTVIVTNGGGIGVMATDACEKYGIKLYDHLSKLKEVFSDSTPSFGSVRNPVDITGQATTKDYSKTLSAALKEDAIDSVIALYCETARFDSKNLYDMIRENYSRFHEKGKPIVFSAFGGGYTEDQVADLKRDGVPVFDDVYEAVSSLGSLYRHYRHLREGREKEEFPFYLSDSSLDYVNGLVETAISEGRETLGPEEISALMKSIGVDYPETRVAHSLEEAVSISRDIGYPVVMKIVSPDITHKSDVGGVALNLEKESEVADAYEALKHNCRSHRPKARIQGVEITEQVQSGTEVIVSVYRDRGFGPTAMFGLGGIYVEVLKDVAFRSLPLTRRGVEAMVKQIETYPLLLGARGEPRKDIESIEDSILRLGNLLCSCDNISDLEINPLIVYEEGVMAVNTRVMLRGGSND